MLFYKLAWGFMKKEMMGIVYEFQENWHMDWQLNTTFVALVPKIEGEKEVIDYIPISLLSGVYKIMAKMIAIRVKKCLSKLVSQLPFGGIENRHIQEAALVANEIIDSRIKENRPGILHNVYFLKAFDIMSRDFLDLL